MSFDADVAARHDEDKLLRQGLRGDADALETLFARNNRALYQTALRLLGNPEDAEDALQDGLLSAYRNLQRFEGRSRFSTWLTRIVINAALMRRRSQRARPTVSLDDPPREDALPMEESFADRGPNPEQAYAEEELKEILTQCLEDLAPPLRSAFLLRKAEGLSTREAADALGVSENAVKARLWRARQELAERLGHRLGKDEPERIQQKSLSARGNHD